jgi:heptosyltransferase III
VQSVLAELPEAARVAAIRLRSLGDCVLTTPALGLLKQFRPGWRIAIVVEDRFRGIFESNPDVEAILPPSLAALRRFAPDLAVNFHGGTRSALLTALCGARWRAGFAHYRFPAAYNLRIPRAQQILGVERKVHTAEHLASAMFYLGVPQAEIPRASIGPALPPAHPPAAVIHAVAAAPDKTWKPEGFLAVARYLSQAGMEPVFIGAAADDLSPFSAYRVVRGASLSEIRRLLAGASLFVGNDSGPAHMAAACGVPVAVVFGSSDPEIWGPWRTRSEVITAPGGIQNVTAERVMAAVERLIRTPSTPAGRPEDRQVRA